MGVGQFVTNPTFGGLGAGEYTFTVRDAGGCSRDTLIKIVQLGSLVKATVTAKTDIGCAGGNSGALTIAGSGGTEPYEYRLNAEAFQASGSFTGLAAGSYTVTVKDATGCTKDTTVAIAPNTSTGGTITPATVSPVCIGTSSLLTASTGTSYQWYRNDTLITGATEKTYSATVSGVYSVGINNGSCEVRSTNKVDLLFRECTEAVIFVPKAFTPNSDNTNDRLIPRMVKVDRLAHFRVYNRWGQLVFQTTTMGEGWDGVFKGVRQPMETYSWTLECIDANGQVVKQSGKTVLIR
ncbi:MAG: T9SS type B sorting domain-containing protein [Sphingobacteriales bacterium]|nr:MAG: T9SS type B sorting domain-containing protein [Sphingobacteriales bacterium]